MVDFRKLIKERRQIDVTNLLAIFNSLDRRTSHLELRSVQHEATESLNKRRKDHDLILKMSTGSGKTTVALLYLLSHMEESRLPVVYLCPTKQLVEQVQEEANKLGINSVIYPAGEPHPDAQGTAGKAIIICTYDKLFNAKTTFDRIDVDLRPIAIVFDDAHAGVEKIRNAFTMRISDSDLYQKFIRQLDSVCGNFHLSKWNQIKTGDPQSFIELPFWIWEPLIHDFQTILSLYENNEDLIFVWPYLQDILRWCRCIVSGSGIEITPEVLPVHECRAFDYAKHRLFMSATLADDSILIRELGCDLQTAQNPICPNSDKGIGERMVLAPTLIDKSLNREWVMKLCAKISSQLNVVVLTPSEKMARNWESVGAKVFLGDNVAFAVKQMKNNSSEYRFVVFSQRYDGVDLPDIACRLLVIDGMPVGEGITDKYDSDLLATPGGVRNRLIYRIEQGMGRAVRSHADYAVILLLGPEIANFIAKSDVLKSMNPDTRAQLQLALDLSELVKEESERPSDVFKSLIKKCITRDEDWRQYYSERIKTLSQSTAGELSLHRLKLAYFERKAFHSAISNNPQESVRLLRKAINEFIKDDSKSEAWYLQRVANYLHDIDPAQALEVQRSAFEKNRSMFCPPGTVKRPLKTGKRKVQEIILNWFNQFENPNGATSEIQNLRARLSYYNMPAKFEQAIMDIAPLLGADGSRPENEYREGPDALWLWPDISLVIEAKNQNIDSLHKKDAGQLLLSLQWFKKTYPTRSKPIPVIVAKISKSDHQSGFPDNTRVLIPEKLNLLCERLENFFLKLAEDTSCVSNPKAILKLQDSLKLLPENFINTYTVKLEELNR